MLVASTSVGGFGFGSGEAQHGPMFSGLPPKADWPCGVPCNAKDDHYRRIMAAVPFVASGGIKGLSYIHRQRRSVVQ
jgi:hypothetical protein